uniref:Embryo surrounding factor 1 brassicaceae domain-containing protein n=1 Tax=Aegilops tauschii subsp. strangulata TaxID=200361 RepID=A0A453MP66_AEGTS
MSNHMTRIHVVALLLTVCLLLATNARCRIIDGGGDNKIHLPNGLCAYKKNWSFCKLDIPQCYCCLASDAYCYATMNICKKECPLGSGTRSSLSLQA